MISGGGAESSALAKSARRKSGLRIDSTAATASSLIGQNRGDSNRKKNEKTQVRKSSSRRKKDAVGDDMPQQQNGLRFARTGISTEDVEDTTRRKRKAAKKTERNNEENGITSMGKTSTAGATCAEATTEKVPMPVSCITKSAEYSVRRPQSSEADLGIGERQPAQFVATSKRKQKKRKRSDVTTITNRNGSAAPSNAALPGGKTVGRAGINNDHSDGYPEGGAEDGPNCCLQGVMHDGAMYLVDQRRQAFSTQRDANGELVRVGIFDGTHGIVLTTHGGNVDAGVLRTEENKGVRENIVGNKGKNKQKKTHACESVTSDAEGFHGTVVSIVEYPFDVEECDHCETSERAYADIAPLLTALANDLGKTTEELSIYDPYYCQGSTAARLASLGFPRVYNRNEDFYKVVQAGQVPRHDVLVTNPPFSGDHIPNILRFCARLGGKPWFVLLPNYVYLKDYFTTSLSGGPEGRSLKPFYLTPPKRYSYHSPRGSRLNIKSSERKTSPFNTFWYIHLGDAAITSKILQFYDIILRNAVAAERCCVARTSTQIPYKMMDSNDPRRKKARDRQRSIDRIRKKKSEWIKNIDH